MGAFFNLNQQGNSKITNRFKKLAKFDSIPSYFSQI